MALDMMRLKLRLDHEHLELVQIHRADEMYVDDETEQQDVIVVDLTAAAQQRSLNNALRESINLDGKINHYRTGFLHNYGFFACNVSPNIADNAVTFIQAYNSAGKMTRSCDTGLSASYLIARQFGESKHSRRLANIVRQSLREGVREAKTRPPHRGSSHGRFVQMPQPHTYTRRSGRLRRGPKDALD